MQHYYTDPDTNTKPFYKKKKRLYYKSFEVESSHESSKL